MNSADALEMLDSQLADHADDPNAELQRFPPGAATVPIATALVRAFVRLYKPSELTPMIIQGDSKVILSPSDLVAQGWPGPAGDSAGLDPLVPRRGDKIVVHGRPRQVIAATPVYLGDQMVRLEMQIRG